MLAGGLVFCLTYAALRYIVFGNVSPAHMPLFVGNKAVSWMALTLVGLAPLLRSKSSRAAVGTLGFQMAAVHGIASLALLSPAYFERLYDATGRLRWQGEISIVLGALALVLLSVLFFATTSGNSAPDASQPRNRYRGYGRLALILGLLHVAVWGYETWWTPEKWYGGLPPITLLATLTALACLVARQLRAPRSN